MNKRRVTWLSTEEVAAQAGMGPDWVRAQIRAGRLRATAYLTGKRRTYRIRSDDWAEFLRVHAVRPGDADWE